MLNVQPPCPIPPRAVDAVVVLREQLRQERENHQFTLSTLRRMVDAIDRLFPEHDEPSDCPMALARSALEQFEVRS